MRRHLRIALPILLVSLCGCAEIRESWEACAAAADYVHLGNSDALCRQFSGKMLEALPCDAVERVLRQMADLVGQPIDSCSWRYTYQVQGIDPLQATAVYKCPFTREDVVVTVTVEVGEAGTSIVGLWSDSPSLRSHPMLLRYELCREIDARRNACVGKLSETAWTEPRISVWNSWQNLRGGDRVAWGWFAPSGEVVADFDYEVEESPPFDYRTWSYIEPAAIDLPDPYGTWTVKIALNGKELEAYPFEVVR
jgi:hypothetical protein